MYMDESGDGGLPRPHGASNTRHMVYAGVVVNGAQNFELRQGTEELLSQFFGEDEEPDELHYGDLINDRGVYENIRGEQKKNIADAVFEVVKDVEPTIIATVIDKRRHGNQYADPWQPKPYIFRGSIARFQYYVDNHGSVGLTICDAEESFIHTQLRKIVNDARSDGVRIVEEGSKLTNIMDSVMFTPSHMSPGIQIADFVAYAIWSKFEYGNDRRYQEIDHLFRDPPDTDFSEPSLLPE